MDAFGWALVTAGIWGMVPVLEKIGLSLGAMPASVAVLVRSVGVLVGLVVCTIVWQPWAALRAVPWRAGLLLAAGGLLASFVGQLAFYQALRVGAVSRITPVAGAYPLVAALTGWLILREPFTPGRALGVFLVVAGVWLLRE